jgi:EpsI family protein
VGAVTEANQRRLLAAGVVLALAGVFSGVLQGLVRVWEAQDEYAHGFLIPVISAYFVYLEKDRLRRIRLAPALWAGLAVLLSGCVLYLAGERGGVVTAERVSLIVVLMGLVLLLLGVEFFRALLFPIVYLIVMIPLVDLSADAIHLPFQLVTATIAAKGLALFGVPVLHSRQYLHLPNVTLEVANLCSGARFFISIVAITVPLAILTQRTALRRVLLLVAGIVISVLANGIRVALIGIWAYRYGAGTDIHGPFHMLQGLFVSVVGYAVLFLVAYLLADRGRPAAAEPMAAGAERALTAAHAGTLRSGLLAVGILAVVGVYGRMIPLRVMPEAGPTEAAAFGDWERRPPLRELRLPGADRELNAAYRVPGGREIGLYRAYFAFQRQGKECVESGSAWGRPGSEPLAVSQAGAGTVRVNAVTFPEAGARYAGLYWYEVDDRVYAGKLEAKVRTALNGLVRNRNNGAVVLVYCRLDEGQSRDAAFAALADFLRLSGLLRSAGRGVS